MVEHLENYPEIVAKALEKAAARRKLSNPL
jgi:hypothetical protein